MTQLERALRRATEQIRDAVDVRRLRPRCCDACDDALDKGESAKSRMVDVRDPSIAESWPHGRLRARDRSGREDASRRRLRQRCRARPSPSKSAPSQYLQPTLPRTWTTQSDDVRRTRDERRAAARPRLTAIPRRRADGTRKCCATVCARSAQFVARHQQPRFLEPRVRARHVGGVGFAAHSQRRGLGVSDRQCVSSSATATGARFIRRNSSQDPSSSRPCAVADHRDSCSGTNSASRRGLQRGLSAPESRCPSDQRDARRRCRDASVEHAGRLRTRGSSLAARSPRFAVDQPEFPRWLAVRQTPLPRMNISAGWSDE